MVYALVESCLPFLFFDNADCDRREKLEKRRGQMRREQKLSRHSAVGPPFLLTLW